MHPHTWEGETNLYGDDSSSTWGLLQDPTFFFNLFKFAAKFNSNLEWPCIRRKKRRKGPSNPSLNLIFHACILENVKILLIMRMLFTKTKLAFPPWHPSSSESLCPPSATSTRGASRLTLTRCWLRLKAFNSSPWLTLFFKGQRHYQFEEFIFFVPIAGEAIRWSKKCRCMLTLYARKHNCELVKGIGWNV